MSKDTSLAPSIRPATVSDADAILDIYNREVLASVVTLDLTPRTLQDQRSYIRDRSGALAVLVAVTQDENLQSPSGRKARPVQKVVGFASLSPYRDRPGYRTSVENSIYVHMDHQREGIGTLLLGAIIEQAESHGFHALFARIANEQEASLGLHTKHGFQLVGVEREVGRKFGQWIDVALMQLLLSERPG